MIVVIYTEFESNSKFSVNTVNKSGLAKFDFQTIQLFTVNVQNIDTKMARIR